MDMEPTGDDATGGQAVQNKFDIHIIEKDMEILLNKQSNDIWSMVGVIDRKLDVVKIELKGDIDAERNERNNRKQGRRYEDLVICLAKVGLQGAQALVGAKWTAPSQWQPQHVILAGWPQKSRNNLEGPHHRRH